VAYTGRTWCVSVPSTFIIARRAQAGRDGVVTKASAPVVMGNCVFDKGLLLGRPEIVPFRLTPNMLDGMGLAGYEGVFRRVSEVAMGVLRGHRDMLVSVLESFIHDPLVEWQPRSAPAPAAAAAAAGAGAAAAGGGAGDLMSTAHGAEKENRDGLKMIKKIGERLDGFYNVGIDAVVPRPGWKSSRAAATTSSMAARKLGSSSLSIPGQVQRLIREATSDENLSLMYLGWLPFM
jgi:serine/threonine-protein kinase ATR